ncbi:MAG: hypothetical protein HZA46_03140 [Planctomycetales bacterium]|nr:hypothetical protein [Planctomycetales bacterium]
MSAANDKPPDLSAKYLPKPDSETSARDAAAATTSGTGAATLGIVLFVLGVVLTFSSTGPTKVIWWGAVFGGMVSMAEGIWALTTGRNTRDFDWKVHFVTGTIGVVATFVFIGIAASLAK